MDAYSRSRAHEMRITETHIFFWGSVLSNWHQGGNFKGSGAMHWLINNLESHNAQSTIKVAIPHKNSPSSQLMTNHSFNCGEQFMMASKAWLFERTGEATVLRSILASKNPADQKALGREVPNFNDKVWDTVSNRVVVASQLARAAVDPKLAIIYRTTGTKVFVEGSPYDNIWGVGVRWDDKRIEDRRNWRGRNKLGECHRIARNLYRQQTAITNPREDPAIVPGADSESTLACDTTAETKVGEDPGNLSCILSPAQQLDHPNSPATTTEKREDAGIISISSSGSEAQGLDVSSLHDAVPDILEGAANDTSKKTGSDKIETASKEANTKIASGATLNRRPAPAKPDPRVQDWKSWAASPTF